MKHTLFLLAVAAVLASCGSGSRSQVTGKNFDEQCQLTISQCDRLGEAVEQLEANPTVELLEEVQQMADELIFDYDPATLDSAQLVAALEVDQLIAELKVSVAGYIDQTVKQGYWYLVNRPEELLGETTEYPVYLERGEKLFVEIETEKPADVRIYNVNSHQLIRSYLGKARCIR